MIFLQPPVLMAGSAHPALARALAESLDLALRRVELQVFPDGEMQVRLDESVGGEHVFLLQPTCTHVERSLFELLLLSDACRRAGARELTAVVPYFGYARQERRATGREALGARVVADMMAAVHIDRVLAVDVHAPSLEGFFAMPFEHLTAFALLLSALADWPRERGVVVAPDLGAAKLAERFARALDVPMAVVHKSRLGGSTVEVRSLSGDVRGRAPLIVDDMISTAGTVEAAAHALLDAGCATPLTVVASHGLFVGPAVERLLRLPLERVVVTDSVPLAQPVPFRVERVSLASLLAQAIRAVALRQALHPLISQP